MPTAISGDGTRAISGRTGRAGSLNFAATEKSDANIWEGKLTMTISQRNSAALLLLLCLAPLALALEEGEKFPAFQLDRADGTTWQSSALVGQPKIVLLWATWCPYCRKLMPGIIELHQEFSPRGLEIIGVNFRDEDGDTEAYAADMGIEFDIVVDGDDLATAVGVRGTPTLFVLDREDRVVLRLADSDPDNPELRDTVEALMPPIASAEDPRIGVFRSSVPYPSRFVEVNGSRLHYLDEGDGQTFLFLHGNPTSSYLWRNVMPYVAPNGRIVALDNVGFGLSDKPDLDYTYQTHYTYLEGFIDALDLDDIVFVLHDWGSVLGLDYARQHQNRVRGVVFMEAIVPPSFPMSSLGAFGPAGKLFGQFRTDGIGQQLIMEQNLFVEQILLNGTQTRQLSQREREAYRAPFPTTESRFPVYVWPNELPIAGEPARNVALINAVGDWLENSPTPKLLQYASPGAIIPPTAAAWMAEHYRNIETQFVGYGTHYIQEDNPEAIGRGIVDWYRRQVSGDPGPKE